MAFVILVFFSTCAFGHSCIHEVVRYETLQECQDAQVKAAGYWTACAVIVEGSERDFNLEEIGELKQ